MQKYVVEKNQRLDVFLAAQAEVLSRAHAQGLIKIGEVSVNGKTIKKPSLMLHEGDAVAVSSFAMPLDKLRAPQDAMEAADLHLAILYEDDACFVINKPAGLAVHPAPTTKGEATVLHGILHLFKERDLPSPSPSPERGVGLGLGQILVHRLDRETTGCLLVAKTPQAHGALQRQFEERSVQKTYLALVAGIPDPPEALIDAPVGRNLTDRTTMSVFRTAVSRDARTTYRTLGTGSGCALLACDLHTGRTHQIRVHLSSIGHPILGDRTYHSPASLKLTEEFSVQNLCLHARKLCFTSPADGKRQTVEAPLPEAFNQTLDVVGLKTA